MPGANPPKQACIARSYDTSLVYDLSISYSTARQAVLQQTEIPILLPLNIVVNTCKCQILHCVEEEDHSFLNTIL